MIGVATHPDERAVVAEFFELFKTPWEFYQAGRRYDVIISTSKEFCGDAAGLVLLYSSTTTEFDERKGVSVGSRTGGAKVSWMGKTIPLYGKVATFPGSRFAILQDEETRQPMSWLADSTNGTVLRIGCDLFAEVRHLLTAGQPAANARIPTLELHIALLRELITGAGLPLVEIPAIPEGCNFIACLTHDIDHPVLRNHRMDHTMFGFMYRATIGSLLDTCSGRKPVRNVRRNWAAACKLPLLHLGMARDCWRGFDRYLEIEAGLGATYFVIPDRDYAGRPLNGAGNDMRACRYAIDDIKPELQRTLSAGCEVAVHGLDAWCDGARARVERDKVRQLTGDMESGVRMHWLYFDSNSQAVLDQAGYSYDSTVGYNETVGFRAGTAQAYRPLSATTLLELPLQIMDTALFYPKHLGLADDEARPLVLGMADDVARNGGALTINWHDRSIAPERLWDGFYLEMLSELKGRGAWFPTAGQAVSWFRKRRSVRIEAVQIRDGVLNLKATAGVQDTLPGLKARVHKPKARNLTEAMRDPAPAQFEDICFSRSLETTISV
jgi:hypothetical protein